MATIYNKNGTDNADVLTYNTAGGIYYAYKGSDTINVTGGCVVVYTGSGNNTIRVTGGAEHTIQTVEFSFEGDTINGADTLTIFNHADRIGAHLGSGKDTINISNSDGRFSNGYLSQIHGGAWGDTFNINAGTQRYQLYGDAGDDTFFVNGGSNLVLWGGAANDTFTVTGGSGIKLRGGDSADVYNIEEGAQAVDLQLGYGNDVVNIKAGDKHTIKGNLGINTINLKAGSDHVITADIDQAASKKAGKEVGYGVDQVYITGAATNVKANLGEGKDIIEVSAGSNHQLYTEGWGDTISIKGSTSNSLIDAGAGDDIIYVMEGSSNHIEGGEGADTIWIAAAAPDNGKNVIDSGSGRDKLIIGGSNNQISCGTEADEVILASGCSKNEIDLGQGNDNVTCLGEAVELSGVVIFGDMGSDTINLNCYAEFTTIWGGDGTELHILKDTCEDTIILGSYEKTGKCNEIHGECGKDTITCINNQYAFIYGGTDADAITCTSLNNSVIVGGRDSDAIALNSVNNSYITGGTLGDFYDGTETIRVTGKSSKNIINMGGNGGKIFANGSMTQCLLIGSAGVDTFTLDSNLCQYNRIYGNGACDEFYINTGSYNTVYAGGALNLLYLSGGNHNLMIGGNYRDWFHVYEGVQDYNLLRGKGGNDVYGVNYGSKVIIDTETGSQEGDMDTISITGARISDMNVKIDQEHNIVKLNDIYIIGSSLEIAHGSSTTSEIGGRINMEDFFKLKLGKTRAYADLSTELANASMNMGDMNRYVALTPEYQLGLETAHAGICEHINKVIAGNIK